ncbi:DUF6415 family natural product biosynthesis protein [Streptomyces sp. NPDC057555]|uniref:DUF6415 family natural product biosynthesis protein n=1 Tax=Streptomyces sp. NPDC057555 TaxID=3346166 RepID=UPI0036AEC4F4
MKTPPKAVPSLPDRERIATETIAATIRRALHFGAGRPTPGELAEVEQLLRRHLTVLLTEVREAAPPQHPLVAEECQMASRCRGIEQHMAEGHADGPLAAHVQVHLLARDCQWLLAHYTARAGW